MDQWVPIINLPERWKCKRQKPVRGLDNLHKSGVNPDGHITIQRSNSKVFQNVDEAREFWEKGKKTTTAVYQGMYLDEEKKKKREIAPRDGFPLWAEAFWSCIRQPRKDEEARVEN